MDFEDHRDAHFRQAFMQARMVGSMKLGESSSLGLGFTYNLNKPIQYSNGNPSSFTPEVRLHQQFDITHLLKIISINHRIKLEERWIQKKSLTSFDKGFNYSMRGRYKLQLSYPLRLHQLGEKKWVIKSYDEIFLNIASKNKPIYDQNRYYIGINYRLFKRFEVELGYLNISQQLDNINNFLYTNCLRLSLYHSLGLGHKVL